MNEEPIIPQSRIFGDKIRLNSQFVLKSFDLINQYNILLNNYKFSEIEEDRLKEYDEFKLSWINSMELYDTLKHKYLKKLSKGDQEKAKEISDNYKSIGKPVGDFNDLSKFYELIIEMMAMTGFYDVFMKEEDAINLEEAFNQ